jgi:hypothetical protein
MAHIGQISEKNQIARCFYNDSNSQEYKMIFTFFLLS